MRAMISRISYAVTLTLYHFFSKKKWSVQVLWCLIFLTIAYKAPGQARLVLNGAQINLTQNVYLVIENSSADAITRNSGHIISEGENNSIRWNIGTTTGTYVIPWGYGTGDYIPLSFTKTAGVGGGYFVFSTYQTGWNNSSYLPAGITNINGAGGTDNSAFVSDRFWKIDAQGYTTKPALSDLEFTYRDGEVAGPNTITESGLRPKRYNSALNSWTDNLLTSSVNTTTNKVSLPLVDAANLHSWWVLGALNATRYWVAAASSSCNLSANWSETSGGPGNAGVPTLDDAVFFDGSSSFNCNLDAGLVASSLTVNSGYLGSISQGSNSITVNGQATFAGGSFIGGPSTFDIKGNLMISGTSFTAPSASLDIKGNLNVSSGTFTHNGGTVIFSGTNGSTQNISSASPLTFNNVLVTNSASSPGVAVQSNQNLSGVLTLGNNVTFDSDGSANTAVFKLLSTGDNPTRDAAVAALPSGAQVSGKVTVQRFMTKEGVNNGRIYRYISSPIQTGTVSDLQQEIPVTGNFTGKSSCSGCVSSSPSLYLYNEAVITDTDKNQVANLDDGYVAFPTISNSQIFQPGRGYALYVRGNLLSSTSWDLRGLINSANVAPIIFPVSHTSSGSLPDDGWNLIGNPFPSTIDWNAPSGWTKTNLGAAIHIPDNSSAALQFATWNGIVGTNGGSRYVATGQGFWVKANGNGAPELEADENVKAAGVQTTFFRNVIPSDLLRISLVRGDVRDETIIHFREDATDSFDSGADALKFRNGTFNLYTKQLDNVNLAINSLPPLECKSTVNLSVENVSVGTYRLNFSEYESFSNDIAIALKDNFSDSTINIKDGKGYQFSVTSNPNSYGSDRFRITFSYPEISTEFLVSASSICEGSDAKIEIENTQKDVYYTVVGQRGIISAAVVGNGGTILVHIPGDSVTLGENEITVQASRVGCSMRAVKELSIYKEKKLPILSSNNAKICMEGTATLVAHGSPKGGHYNWYESETSFHFDVHDSTFVTPMLSKSKTYFVSVVTPLGCEGHKELVRVEVIHLEAPQISYEEATAELKSSYTEGNRWYFNDELITDSAEQTIVPNESGTYSVVVNVEGCVAGAEYEFIVAELEEQSSHGIFAFPNPVQRDVTVSISNSFKNLKQIVLLNATGQTIKVVNPHQQKDVPYSIDMTALPSGTYILRVVGSGLTTEIKLLKL